MILLIQLFLFAFVCWYRRRFMVGRHLQKGEAGIPFMYMAKGKYGVSHLHVGVECERGFPFIIRRERWYHRFLTSIGIASEIETGDAALDRALYFITDYPDHLRLLLASGGIEKDIGALFAGPVSAVYAASGRLWAVIASGHKNDALARFSPVVETLTRIGKALSKESLDALAPVSKRHTWIALLLMAAHMGLFYTALAGWMPYLLDHIEAVDMRQMLTDGLYYGIAAVLLWLLMILVFLRGTAWVGMVLVDFLVYGWLGILLCSIYLVRDVNVMADVSPPQIHALAVIDKQCTLKCESGYGRHKTTRSYNLRHDDCAAPARPEVLNYYRNANYTCRSSASFSYMVFTRSWRPDRRYYKYDADARHFDSLELGKLVDIPTHRGALGIEWVDQNEIRVTR